MNRNTKAALALLTALGTATLAPTAHAGNAFAEGISQNITVGSFISVAGGEGRFGPITIKFGARETVSHIGLIENQGTIKGFSQNIKVSSFINAGTDSRIGGYYNRN